MRRQDRWTRRWRPASATSSSGTPRLARRRRRSSPSQRSGFRVRAGEYRAPRRAVVFAPSQRDECLARARRRRCRSSRRRPPRGSCSRYPPGSGLVGRGPCRRRASQQPLRLARVRARGVHRGAVVLSVAGAVRRPLGPDERDDVVVSRPSPRRLALEVAVASRPPAASPPPPARSRIERRGRLRPVSRRQSRCCSDWRAGSSPCVSTRCRSWVSRGSCGARVGSQSTSGSTARRGSRTSARRHCSCSSSRSRSRASPRRARHPRLGQNRSAWRASGPMRGSMQPHGSRRRPPRQARLASRRGRRDRARAYVQDVEVGEPGPGDPDDRCRARGLRAHRAGTRPPSGSRPSFTTRRSPASFRRSSSTNWPATGTFPIRLPGVTVNTIVVGNRDSFPGVPAETPFAIVPYSAFEGDRGGGRARPPEPALRRGVGSSAVRAAVAGSGARVESTRAHVVSDLRASPLIENVLRGFRAAIILAALYAAVAVGLLGLIAARSRSRDLALVRTMGASPRDASSLPPSSSRRSSSSHSSSGSASGSRSVPDRAGPRPRLLHRQRLDLDRHPLARAHRVRRRAARPRRGDGPRRWCSCAPRRPWPRPSDRRTLMSAAYPGDVDAPVETAPPETRILLSTRSSARTSSRSTRSPTSKSSPCRGSISWSSRAS